MRKAAKVLLIDDDADDRELFCEAWTDIASEIPCDALPDGRQAFQSFEQKEADTPDLIFLDINMPLMSGWQCLEILKGKEGYKQIPVIMYSTSSYPEDIYKAQKMGALCFFSKPLAFEELKTSLKLVVTHLTSDSLSSLSLSSPVFMVQ